MTVLAAAIRYLTAFIAEKGNLAAAYKLLGQIQEMQEQPALDAYKRSLDLDATQNDVLLKGFVCRLFIPWLTHCCVDL